jgi:hypothetical protein
MTRPAHGFFPFQFGKHAKDRWGERFPDACPWDSYHRAVEVERVADERRLYDPETDAVFCVVPSRDVPGGWYVRTILVRSRRAAYRACPRLHY